MSALSPQSLADLAINVTADPIIMAIAERLVIPVVVTVPANSTVDVFIDVNVPVDESAVMTVSKIELAQVRGRGHQGST
jgi:ribosomal protein S2